MLGKGSRAVIAGSTQKVACDFAASSALVKFSDEAVILFFKTKNSCSASIWVPTPMHLLTVKTAIFYNPRMRNYKYNE